MSIDFGIDAVASDLLSLVDEGVLAMGVDENGEAIFWNLD